MRKNRFARRKEKRQKIARERIKILMELAEKASHTHPERASRYLELARKIGKRYNVRLPSEYKLKYCKMCGTYRQPGSNSRTRIVRDRLVITCLKCGSIYRKPLGPKPEKD